MEKYLTNVLVEKDHPIGLNLPPWHMHNIHRSTKSSADTVGIGISFAHEDARRVNAKSFVISSVRVWGVSYDEDEALKMIGGWFDDRSES